MKLLFYSALIIAVVSVIACTLTLRPSDQNAIELDAVTIDVSEAFFRYEFENKKDAKKDIFFIEIQGKDPPRELLRRFKDHAPPVKKASSNTYSDEPPTLHINLPDPVDEKDRRELERIKRDNNRAIREYKYWIKFWITDYKWSGDNKVVVHGGLYMGPLGIEKGYYTLEKINGKWRVVEYRAGLWG